ncbi:MAG: hypothetical protein ACO3JG_03785 [Luteolibacter sp.]
MDVVCIMDGESRARMIRQLPLCGSGKMPIPPGPRVTGISSPRPFGHSEIPLDYFGPIFKNFQCQAADKSTEL